MSAQKKRSARVALLVLGLALTCSLSAWARPGGGNSYSGGSHSSGGGGGGGDAVGLIFQLLLLCIEYPAIGVPLILIIIVFLIVKGVMGAAQKGWSTTTPEAVQAVQQVEQDARLSRMDLSGIQRLDPEFSLVLFEDFAYMLYAAVQRARATGGQTLAAYLEPSLAQNLVDPQLADVQGIVIGAMRYVRFSGTQSPMIEIELELEANYVEVLRSGGSRRFYVVDRVVLSRAATAKSRPF
jgi:hypothetical protein